MLEDGTYNEEDIQVMKNGLASDGWATANFLPNGWMMKTSEFNSENRYRKMYLSAKFDVLRGLESVLVYMKENGVSENSILKFKEGCLNKWKKEENLPTGWINPRWSAVPPFQPSSQGASFHTPVPPFQAQYSTGTPSGGQWVQHPPQQVVFHQVPGANPYQF